MASRIVACPTDARYFRPRRRPWLRASFAAGVTVALVAAAIGAVWMRTHVVPPGCQAPETLAQVHRSLTQTFKLPASATLQNVETVAGGYLAFRFTCVADLRNIDPHDLPPGTYVPGSITYTSRLAQPDRHHEVAVYVHPRLKLVRVQ